MLSKKAIEGSTELEELQITDVVENPLMLENPKNDESLTDDFMIDIINYYYSIPKPMKYGVALVLFLGMLSIIFETFLELFPDLSFGQGPITKDEIINMSTSNIERDAQYAITPQEPSMGIALVVMVGLGALFPLIGFFIGKESEKNMSDFKFTPNLNATRDVSAMSSPLVINAPVTSSVINYKVIIHNPRSH
ncbi:hypothetical protein CANARDRAFT_30684 [[Candida] arabinofermentans NRRL YB-2248]|uniref:Uncharacterized protein n=1 Tax=[Candida] arabinofermentans NRRL YB-2248 TaxID=983967 RepID=A0A1E4ST83_9ASCO|nr:hypothetical protein CANARDRAFT_30684 [[Candida] arabinofermentans NRRL YB-2248]